jgi:peroxiredoxin
VGARAPTFSLPVLGRSGTDLSLASLRGRYVVLNFWASTCAACVAEMPHLEQAYRALGPDTAFVGIDVADDASAAASFAKRVGVTYPLVSDDSGSVAGAYQISGLPFTIVVSPSGKLLIRHPGSITTEQLAYVLETYQPSLAAGARGSGSRSADP